MNSHLKDIADYDELRANPSHPDWEILRDFLSSIEAIGVSTWEEINRMHHDYSDPRWKQLETAFKQIRGAS